MTRRHFARAGFTLLEILLVVAAIAILAGIVIIAINPGKQLADTRNAQRRIDVNTILNAVYQYAIDHNGALPSVIPTSGGGCSSATSTNQICKTGGTCTGLVDLSSTLTVTSTYLVGMPMDPSVSTGEGSGYYIVTTTATSGRVTVCAPNAEQSATISVTR
jgi:prepilin-type N-terminal cleavage/methylation domain-containing protein